MIRRDNWFLTLDRGCIILHKKCGFVLADALFALMIYLSIVTLLFLAIIFLIKTIKQFDQSSFSKISQWQNEMVLRLLRCFYP